jgi:hypothetical protein
MNVVIEESVCCTNEWNNKKNPRKWDSTLHLRISIRILKGISVINQQALTTFWELTNHK